jgi:excisionase family DNA binding protein
MDRKFFSDEPSKEDLLARGLYDLVAEAVKEGVRLGILEAAKELGLSGRARDGDERLLTVRETAERLGVSRRTVYELVWGQRLRCVRIGRKVLIPASAVAGLAGLGDRVEEFGPVPRTEGQEIRVGR